MTKGVTPRARKDGRTVYQAWVWIPDRGGLTPAKRSRVFPTEAEAIAWHQEGMLPVLKLLQQEQDAKRTAQQAKERAAQEVLGAAIAEEVEFHLQQPPCLPDEQWREIPGRERQYEVSDLGRIWSRPRKRVPGGFLSPSVNKKGYQFVTLGNRRSKYKIRKMHELVLTTFVCPRPPGLLCRHLNGNPADNRLVNLRWGTPEENAQDMILHGRTKASNTHCVHDHEYTEASTYWRPDGARSCRICQSEQSRRRRKT